MRSDTWTHLGREPVGGHCGDTRDGRLENTLLATRKEQSREVAASLPTLEDDLGPIQRGDDRLGDGSGDGPAQQGVQHRPSGPQVLWGGGHIPQKTSTTTKEPNTGPGDNSRYLHLKFNHSCRRSVFLANMQRGRHMHVIIPKTWTWITATRDKVNWCSTEGRAGWTQWTTRPIRNLNRISQLQPAVLTQFWKMSHLHV